MTRKAAVLAAALISALLGGCGRHDAATQTPAPEHQMLANPSSFPLYPRSQVVTVVPVDSAQMFAAIRASDPKASVPRNFRGHEVIAETGASIAQLRTWANGLASAPPRGLHRVVENSDGHVKSGFNANGNDAVGMQFETADGGRSVYVVAADPRKIRQQLGPVFGLIDNYGAVPGMMRGPIDDSAKKQLGYSVTEMLDAKSPIGAVVATLKRMQSVDRRAILIIDESRQ